MGVLVPSLPALHIKNLEVTVCISGSNFYFEHTPVIHVKHIHFPVFMLGDYDKQPKRETSA